MVVPRLVIWVDGDLFPQQIVHALEGFRNGLRPRNGIGSVLLSHLGYLLKQVGLHRQNENDITQRQRQTSNNGQNAKGEGSGTQDANFEPMRADSLGRAGQDSVGFR